MDFSAQFEQMRPYRDHEVKPAVERLVSHPGFEDVLNYLYPGQDTATIIRQFRKVETIDQFQHLFSGYTVNWIVDHTSEGLTDSGAGDLDTSKAFLFVANHRDIVLDAAIMQYLLDKHGHRTSQITFGENLMTGQLLLDMGKLNKMFTFYRGGNRVEQYRKAVLNSAYINQVIKHEKESIWIAQRNGRTKDGDDRTQPGLIRMFALNTEHIFRSLRDLNIVPVTISYEIEPCGIQKVRERYIAKRETYQKGKDEDLQSILTGIKGSKGRIHYAFGTPLNSFLEELSESGLEENEVYDRVAAEIDRQVHNNYRLWPGNYVAADMLSGKKDHAAEYTVDELREFTAEMDKQLGSLEGFSAAELRQLYLEMYANPVKNSQNLKV